MAIIHEKCPDCGERAAWHEGDAIMVSHKCEKAPPGPVDPPRRYPVAMVNFVRGEFTQEQWRKEFDALCADYQQALSDRLSASDTLRQVQRVVDGWIDFRDRAREG